MISITINEQKFIKEITLIEKSKSGVGSGLKKNSEPVKGDIWKYLFLNRNLPNLYIKYNRYSKEYDEK